MYLKSTVSVLYLFGFQCLCGPCLSNWGVQQIVIVVNTVGKLTEAACLQLMGA